MEIITEARRTEGTKPWDRIQLKRQERADLSFDRLQPSVGRVLAVTMGWSVEGVPRHESDSGFLGTFSLSVEIDNGLHDIIDVGVNCLPPG